MKKSVSFYTLGCKLNFSETSTLSRQMSDAGFEKLDFNQGADVYVINTCSVTDHADRKCKKVVNEALRYNPSAFVVIVGCYAQLKPEEIANIPGVNMVLGAAEKFNIVEHLQELVKTEKPKVMHSNIKDVNTFVPAYSFGDRTRTFMKLQDGCDYFCSFCTIPLARGRSRSPFISEILPEVKKIANNGTKEIVLTGVNLGDFGVQNNETFTQLVSELEKIEEVSRYRISSIEPNLLTDDIIKIVSSSDKFMPHFHIPLQSGSNKILKLMRRRYERELYAERVKRIKELMPHACIGVDVIVGFPDETHEDFLETYQFLNELDISYLHVFPYSERTNTTAAKMKERVPVKTRGERTEMLRNLSEKKRRYFYEQHIGSSRKVLLWKTLPVMRREFGPCASESQSCRRRRVFR
ncbi:MAG: tRNA (N(6)-L-threonylcarbamoyladenosine(37)-C(2))-methylthiotransferase MtaB, partial [Bacteroidetes bacterium]|nr:tRNA (N(6)-L-threonylcarbamoyladenosine(37)-C(2))-methylthiotransferase MtaB [Bacteroidota bacterium]